MVKQFVVVAALALGLVTACNNAGDNATLENDSTGNATKEDTANKAALELVFSDNTYQITGIAKNEGGMLLVNYPRWSNIYRYAVAEVTGDTASRPYPNDTMNRWLPGQSGKDKWVCVQSVYFDDNGGLWILDPAAPMLKTIQGAGAKLVKMNKQTNKPERTYSFMRIVPDTAYVNDVKVDVTKNFAYLTESKGGGIIVVDLASGNMRRLLSNHPSTKSDPAYKFIVDGRELMKNGKPAKFNSDGIALTPDGDWLYYKPVTDDKLYRIKTEFLRDVNMNDTMMNSKVEDLGHFASTDGMIFDKAGNLYLGDIQNYRDYKVNCVNRILESASVLKDS